MKTTIKKAVKKVIKKVKEKLLPAAPTVQPTKCPACLGSGLWRPDFTNSPQCETCKGHGVITN